MLRDNKNQNLWDRLTGLLARENLSAADLRQGDNLNLSIAALLVHIAAGDEDYDEKEQRAIRAILLNELDIPYEMITRMMEEAKKQSDDAIDFYGFVRVINRNFDQAGRLDVVRMLWRVVFADGKIKHKEDQLMRKICHLLGVVWHDSVILKEEVYDMRMWDQIVDFFHNEDIAYSDFSQEQNLHISAAALFIHAALADKEFHESEFERIKDMIRNRFGYSEELIEHLITHADRTRNEILDIDEFIDIIRAKFSPEEIRGFFAMIWEVIIADGKIHPFEQRLANLLAPRFNIGPMEHEEIKNEVLGKASRHKSGIQKLLEESGTG
ncbi:MAG: TerB family tellurite resistance protein [Alphaproteobacteria bacterium]|nr:MAG: TerB family tellurite resistance protein [Alphaproteobacteria bacterium]